MDTSPAQRWLKQLERLPELAKQIILIDQQLTEIRKAKIVRLSGDVAALLRSRKRLVREAHQRWGMQAKGKDQK